MPTANDEPEKREYRRVSLRPQVQQRHLPAQPGTTSAMHEPFRTSQNGIKQKEVVMEKSPFVVLGGSREQKIPVCTKLAPSAQDFFGPRGACLVGERVFVCDTGHHRLLGWNNIPLRDRQEAEIIIGQSDFQCEKRNSGANIDANTLNMPVGICRVGLSGIAIADSWNHRVLIWLQAPISSNTPADIVLGQSNFKSGEPNRGGMPSAVTMNFPSGVAFENNRLFVADSGNRRMLVWKELPAESGEPANLVMGQLDFGCRDENAGHEVSPIGMRWPHGIAVGNQSLFVADAGNNRIMVWNQIPDENGQPCQFVLGQENMQSCSHNQANYSPNANSLNMPYGLSLYGPWLFVADTANSRVVGFDAQDIRNGAEAVIVLGQLDMNEKGENRWMPAVSNSLCWPYSVTACGGKLLISDSGNNRVSIWNI